MPKAVIGAAIFAYTDPKTKARRYAHTGDEVNLTDEDYARLERGGGIATKSATTTAAGPAKPYEEMTVSEAVEFLEALPEDQRDPYFEMERDKDRKGVLKHFDQE